MNKIHGDSNISPDNFNEFFSTVGVEVIENIPQADVTYEYYLPTENLLSEHATFSFAPVSYIEVNDIISSLKKTNSKDVFSINLRIILAIRYTILCPLTKLINKCIANNIFPTILKISKVVPIHKKGSADEPSNFRPISVIPTIGKIYEVILKTQLIIYLENNNFLTHSQFGFRAKHSTTLAINKLTEIISQGFENNEFTSVEFLDLTKAFDCVSHDILLHKLKFFNISVDSIALITSYLSDRMQYVLFNNNKSDLRKIECGVPQGSILGPILFLLYINDLPNASPQSDLILYADDTTTVQSNSDAISLVSRIETQQKLLEQWFLANKLKINTSKTESIIFSLRPHDTNLTTFSSTTCTKFLGVYVDEKLSWQQHIEHLCKKMSSFLFLLRNLSHNVSNNILLTAYYGLIHANISYAIITWGHSSHCSDIFGIQRKALRIISGLQYRDDCKNAFKELKIMTLPCIYIFQCLVYIKENEHKYKSHSQIHHYQTRNRQNIQPNYLRLSRTRNSISYYAPIFYNVLPAEIRALEENQYRNFIKTFLIEHAFYSFNEFLTFDFYSSNSK